MSSHSTLTAESPAVPRRRRRRWVILALFLGAVAVGSGWFYSRISERTRVLAAIEVAGGRAGAPNTAPFVERIFAMMFGKGDPEQRYTVMLRGPKFDDAWLHEHHDLRSLAIDELVIIDAAISREGALRLLGRNRLITFIVPGMPLTDADMMLIGQQEQLHNVNVMQSEITDAGLQDLNLEPHGALNIAGTRVTPTAIEDYLGTKGSQLRFIGLDGRKFTPEVAARLIQTKNLDMVSLMGPEIGDAHLTLLASMPGLRSIVIDQTSASEEAIAALKAANPQANVDVFDSETTLLKWRR